MKKISILFLALVTMLCLVFAAGCGASGAGASSRQFKSGDLSNYTIVYAQDNPDYYDLANRLADHILEKYGTFLIPTSDAAPPAEFEILLGDTNRSDLRGKIMEYSIAVDDGKLRILAGGSYSAEQAVDYLCERVFTGREFALDSGKSYEMSFLTAPNAVTDGTTARIMSANILADAFADNSYRSANYRAEIFAGMLVSYTPDVLGLQETDESWNKVLDSYLAKIEENYGISYATHLATFEDKVNYTSLLYRQDKFQVSDSGVEVFTWWTDSAFRHSYHMRNITWAQFTCLEDANKKFILANTHWSYRTEHADSNICLAGSASPIATNELRTQCKDETDAFLSTLKQTYPDTPIVLTGDFNTSLPFFTESGWTPTSFQIISEEARKNATAMAIVPTSGHFDHIFATGSYTINRYDFFNDAHAHDLLTDHPFVYTDLTF